MLSSQDNINRVYYLYQIAQNLSEVSKSFSWGRGAVKIETNPSLPACGRIKNSEFIVLGSVICYSLRAALFTSLKSWQVISNCILFSVQTFFFFP